MPSNVSVNPGFSWPGNSHHNRGLRNTDKSTIHEVFPLPSLNIPTRGTNMGVILRFKTFYLKVYDDTGEDGFLIKGYRYRKQIPVFEYIVLTKDLRRFAAQFTREDYLAGFDQPCDHPQCVLWQHQMSERYPGVE